MDSSDEPTPPSSSLRGRHSPSPEGIVLRPGPGADGLLGGLGLCKRGAPLQAVGVDGGVARGW